MQSAISLQVIIIFVNRYKVSQEGECIVKGNQTSNVSTTNLYQKSGDVIYESDEPDEMQCAKLATINATANTAINMQENPAYAYVMINETKPKPEDTDDYI